MSTNNYMSWKIFHRHFPIAQNSFILFQNCFVMHFSMASYLYWLSQFITVMITFDRSLLNQLSVLLIRRPSLKSHKKITIFFWAGRLLLVKSNCISGWKTFENGCLPIIILLTMAFGTGSDYKFMVIVSSIGRNNFN